MTHGPRLLQESGLGMGFGCLCSRFPAVLQRLSIQQYLFLALALKFQWERAYIFRCAGT